MQISENEKKKLIIKENGNYELLSCFLSEYEGEKQKEIQSFMVKNLTSDEIDLEPLKNELLNAINQKGKIENKVKLLENIDILFFDDANNRKKWKKAIEEVTGNSTNSQAPKKLEIQNSNLSKNILIINKIDEIIKSIKLIIQLLQKNSLKFSQDYYFNQFISNKSLVFACEYAFTLFYIPASELFETVEEVKDYKDVSAWSIFFTDPIENFKNELAQYLQYRHKIAHLHHVYLNPARSAFMDTSDLFNFLEHITMGIYFPAANVITPQCVTKQPMRAESLLDKLKHVRKLAVKAKQVNCVGGVKSEFDTHSSDEDQGSEIEI